MYALIRPLLFRLDAERAHDAVMTLLAAVSRSALLLRLLARSAPVPRLPCRIAGLEVPNPLGLAAGLDKHAAAFPALSALGFGWIEVGTVTPRPQPGNSRPRLFRAPAHGALINRMGFNSIGARSFCRNLSRLRRNTRAIVGVNIGKNAQTPLDGAARDYGEAMDAVYTLSDYIAVNVSSPNTEALRDLQQIRRLDDLMRELVSHRDHLASEHRRRVPLMLKIAPDLADSELDAIADVVLERRIDAVIAANTTVSRPGDPDPAYRQEGGLSGRPLKELSTGVVASLFPRLGGEVPIIGVGGLEDTRDVLERVRAGAEAVQLYTAFVYQGPAVVQRILAGLEREMQSMHSTNWSSFVGKVRGKQK